MWYIFTYQNPNQQNGIEFSTYAVYADNFQVAKRKFAARVRDIFQVELQDHEYKYSVLDYSDQEDGKVHWLSHIMTNDAYSTSNEPDDFDE